MHFSELLKAVAGARCQLPQDPEIESVVSDSRQVGPDALFVAIRGMGTATYGKPWSAARWR